MNITKKDALGILLAVLVLGGFIFWAVADDKVIGMPSNEPPAKVAP
jgi:hypothetical protein